MEWLGGGGTRLGEGGEQEALAVARGEGKEWLGGGGGGAGDRGPRF